MVEEKPGKTPDQEGGVGTEKDGAEVAGRRKRVLYTCWKCGSNN